MKEAEVFLGVSLKGETATFSARSEGGPLDAARLFTQLIVLVGRGEFERQLCTAVRLHRPDAGAAVAEALRGLAEERGRPLVPALDVFSGRTHEHH